MPLSFFLIKFFIDIDEVSADALVMFLAAGTVVGAVGEIRGGGRRRI